VTQLAVNTRDADALAKVIDSKIGLIERLTQERINITAELERLSRAKREQLDRVDFSFFSVTVSEILYFDWRALGDSWRHSLQSFVQETNGLLQKMTLGLLSLLLFVVEYAVYLVLLLLCVKYGWRLARFLWTQ
jgi:hypothetical protein